MTVHFGQHNHVCIYRILPRFYNPVCAYPHPSQYMLYVRFPSAEMESTELVDVTDYLMAESRGVGWMEINRAPITYGDIITIGMNAYWLTSAVFPGCLNGRTPVDCPQVPGFPGFFLVPVHPQK